MRKFCYGQKRIITVILTMALISSVCCIHSFATAYSGKGTKSSPYLVQTFEQLQGMSANLGASYKLANTIDCAGQTLTPIGFLASPFTGTFSCDKNADGTPKFAIKNLSISVSYGKYLKDNSKWEAGLFGCTSGAKISNIAVLNASVNSEVIGQNQMNPDWSKNPGQDEQSTGVLVGIAKKTTLEHCTVSGNINSKSNHCGGMVGYASNSTINYCYSTVSVTSSGLWCVGGIVGSMIDGKISYSYATGNVVTLASGSGGLIGSCSGAITNCYATGAIGRSTASEESGSLYGCGGTRPKPKACSNSYSLSQINGLAKSPVAASTSTECYVVSAADCYQEGFQPASKQEIIAKFSAMSGWTAAGDIATIKDIAVISDAGAYTPATVDTSKFEKDSQNSTSSVTSQSSEESSVQNDAGSEVKKYTPEEIGEEIDSLTKEMMSKDGLSEDSAFKVLEIKKAFEELSEEDTAKVSSSAAASLKLLYDSAVTVIMSKLAEEIEALPSPSKVNSKNADQVLKVWEKYQKLPEDMQESFTQDDVDKLKKCYEAAKQFENVSVITQDADSKAGTLEIIVIVLLAVLNAAVLAAAVYMFMINLKTSKKLKQIISTQYGSSDDIDTSDESEISSENEKK